MKPKSFHRSDELLKLCSQLHPEDGLNAKQVRSRNKTNNNSQQAIRRARLTNAVRQALKSAMAAYPQFDDLLLIDIDDNNPACLTVVMGANAAHATQLITHEQALQQLCGAMRSTIAAAVRRKRVPQLRFRVVPLPSEHID